MVTYCNDESVQIYRQIIIREDMARFWVLKNKDIRRQFHMIYCCFCGSVTKLCLTLCNPMNCSMAGSSVLYYLQEFLKFKLKFKVSGAI